MKRIFSAYLYRMRKRLDLDMLLDKYDTARAFPSSAPSPKLLSPSHGMAVQPWSLKTEEDYFTTSRDDYYGNKVANRSSKVNYYTSRDKMGSVNFQMSKSQCKAFLVGMRDELKRQGTRMEQHVNISINHLLQKFARDHEILKKQLLEFVSASMENSKKQINQMIHNYKSHIAKEYDSPNNRMIAVNRQISRLLTALNGGQYRRAIAEVVTQDYEGVMKSLRQQVSTSHEKHRIGIAVVQMSTGKVQIIKEALQNIYQWKGQRQTINNWIPTEEMEDYKQNTRTKHKIFGQSRKLAQSQGLNQANNSAPKRMQGTFFNFDSNY